MAKRHYTGAELIADLERKIVYLKEAQKAEAEQYPPMKGAKLARVVKLIYIYLQDQKEVVKWCLTHIEGFSDSQARAYTRVGEVIDKGISEDKVLDDLCKQIRQDAKNACKGWAR